MLIRAWAVSEEAGCLLVDGGGSASRLNSSLFGLGKLVDVPVHGVNDDGDSGSHC